MISEDKKTAGKYYSVYINDIIPKTSEQRIEKKINDEIKSLGNMVIDKISTLVNKFT